MAIQARNLFQHPNLAIGLGASQIAVPLQHLSATAQSSNDGLATPEAESGPDQESETEVVQNTSSQQNLLGHRRHRFSGPGRNTTW